MIAEKLIQSYVFQLVNFSSDDGAKSRQLKSKWFTDIFGPT